MDLRLPMRRFVRIFLCCVTLLELVDKNTFGFNKGSLQRQASKRSSSFYKVDEGMLKKVFKKVSFRILQFTCAGQKVHSFCISSTVEGKLHTSFGQTSCVIGSVENRSYTTQASWKIQMSLRVYRFPKISRKKSSISIKWMHHVLKRFCSCQTLTLRWKNNS